MEAKSHEIVVVGGNMGGVLVVHYLLQKSIPSLKLVDSSVSYRITLITPNSHYFYKIGSPRTLTGSKALPDKKIFRPLTDGLQQYSKDQLVLVQGAATSLDERARTVTVDQGQEVHYDSIFLCTGTTSKSPLWTLHKDDSATLEALHDMQSRLPHAKTILVAGGGAVGIETAGEIASRYQATTVTLLSGGERLLSRSFAATGARAEAYLKDNLNVEVIHNVRAEGVEQLDSIESSDHSSQSTVKLSDGTVRKVDLYIDATGGRPNTDYLPKQWLDDSKRVTTRGDYFRVKDNVSDDVSRAYAVGDIVAGSDQTAIALEAMVPTACSAFAVDMAAELRQGRADRGQTVQIGYLAAVIEYIRGNNLKHVEFRPLRDTILVPIGTSGGVGQIFGWRIPSLLVYVGKGRTYLIEKVEPYLSGSFWTKLGFM